MIYNDEIERFLSSDVAMESTKRKMETSRSRLDDLALVSELRDEFIGNHSPEPNRIQQICRAHAESCIRAVLEEFGENIMSDPFFTLPMQGQSSEFAQRIIMEPLNNSARSAFQSEKPQIVWCDPSDSSRRYGRGAQRARCGFSGETHTGRAFARSPLRFGSLIWNNQTTLAEAEPEPRAKTRRARAELFRGSL
jgi:hypothetical protein